MTSYYITYDDNTFATCSVRMQVFATAQSVEPTSDQPITLPGQLTMKQAQTIVLALYNTAA